MLLYIYTCIRTHFKPTHHTYTHTLQGLLDRLVSSNVMTAYERDYELDKLCWFFDEMGGGVEGKRKKTMGTKPMAGKHYRPCTVTTGAYYVYVVMNQPHAFIQLILVRGVVEILMCRLIQLILLVRGISCTALA